MNPFSYERTNDAGETLRLIGNQGAKYLGGGTNLVDLMRETLEKPEMLIDVTGLSQSIHESEDGGLLIGAGARNTSVAERCHVTRIDPFHWNRRTFCRFGSARACTAW